MEVKNGFLIFTDVEGDLCCLRLSVVESAIVDSDENLYITTNSEQYQVLDAEKIAISKLIEMF